MRLVTFGCSLTQGYGIETQTLQVSDKAWPSILGKLLNCEVLNYGRGGSSCKEVHWTLLNHKFKLGDFVIMLWPQTYGRWCVIGRKTIRKYLLSNINDTTAQQWFDSHYHREDSLIDLHQRIQHAHWYLNQQNIKNYHAYTNRLGHMKKYSWFDVDMLRLDMKQLRARHPTCKFEGDPHPGEECHEAYAKELYTYLNVVL